MMCDYKTVYLDEFLTIPELSKRTHRDKEWLRAATKRKEDPLPSYQVSSHITVLWSEYVEWARRLYSNLGTRRGRG